MQRCVSDILLILLERVQPGPRNGGSGYTPELVERQTMVLLGNPQSQRCRLGGHHRRSDFHMGRQIPEKNRSQNEDREAMKYMVRTTGGDGSWYIMVPPVISWSASLVLEQIGQKQFCIAALVSGFCHWPAGMGSSGTNVT
jgi:hypothetical protein